MRIRSPAKINLFLHITGRRADGYHELFTLMCCVDLADTVGLDFDTGDISIHCDHAGVPRDRRNLAFQAAAVFFEQTGIKSGLSITIDKNIPVAGGLGGGSSNAAAVLYGLNRHFKHPVPRRQLERMAAGIGADVPFFLSGRPALATGIGERLTPYPLLNQTPVIIINPGFTVSTAAVYKKYSFELTNDKNKVKSIIFTEKTVFDTIYLVNDLENVTAAWHPEIQRAKQRLLDHGASGALMSGSGPSVFGLFPDMEAAQEAYNRLDKSPDERIFLTQLLTGDDTAKG